MSQEHETQPCPITMRELIDAVTARKPGALERLVREFGPHIDRAVRRQRSARLQPRDRPSDLAQITWESICRDPQLLAGCETGDDVVRRLTQLAANAMRLEERQWGTQKRDPRREQPLDDEPLGREPRPDEAALAQDEIEALYSGLNDAQQTVVRLRLAGHGFRQIAKTVGLHERTVRKLLEELKRRLQRRC